VQGPDDTVFLHENAGDGLIGWIGYEPAVRAMEQGLPLTLADLSPGTSHALDALHKTLDAQVKDWAKFTRQAVDFHLKNARAWANAATGTDLSRQIDPDFAIDPEVAAGTR